MRQLLVLISIIFLFSCSEISFEENFNLSPIEKELSGETIGKQSEYLKKNIVTPTIEIDIFANQDNNKVIELDIYLKKTKRKGFIAIQNFYNTKFSTLQKDTVFNTWQTDSTEFILYKNSDSSILVNILKRK